MTDFGTNDGSHYFECIKTEEICGFLTSVALIILFELSVIFMHNIIYRCVIGLFFFKNPLLKIKWLIKTLIFLSKKLAQTLGSFAKSLYLCTRFQERTI